MHGVFAELALDLLVAVTKLIFLRELVQSEIFDGIAPDLQAAVAEYLGSCGRHGVAVPAGLHLLAVDVALLTDRPHQVFQTVLLSTVAPA